MQAGTTGFSEAYNPLALTTANVVVDRRERRRRPAGRARLQLRDGRTPGCEINLAQLPNGFGVANIAQFDPDIKRMYNIEESVEHTARAAAARVGDGRLVPSRLQEPASPRQRSPDLRRLHAVHAVQPDRRQPDHLLQREPRPRVSGCSRSIGRAGQRSQDVVQRLRIQLQRPHAARHHAFRRRQRASGRSRSSATSSGTRTCCSIAISGTAACRSGPSSSSPARCQSCRGIQTSFSFQSLPGYRSGCRRCRRPTAYRARTASLRSSRCRRRTASGTVWFITPTTTYAASTSLRRAGQVPGRRPGGPRHDTVLALGAARGAEDRVRRSHQPARFEYLEDVPVGPRLVPAEDRLLQRAEQLGGLRRPDQQQRDELRHRARTCSRNQSSSAACSSWAV